VGDREGTHELCSQDFRPHGAKRNSEALEPEEKTICIDTLATLSTV
jgi:hypothetical protein